MVAARQRAPGTRPASHPAARLEGFTLPLTIALAFSLMSLATAIVGMVVVSDKQAKAAASDVVIRASLESALETGLFDIEQNGEPQQAEWTGEQTFNGRDVRLVLANTRYKPDINHALPAEAGAAIADRSLSERTLAALSAPAPDQSRPGFLRFADFVQAVGASAAEEDCLRRRLTLGRGKGPGDPPPPPTALIASREALVVGEVIDVRAETRDWAGRLETLWRRVRYTGKPEHPWLTHDWRLMRLGRAEPACPVVEAAATIPTAPPAHGLPSPGPAPRP
jgi:hypothetical protein